MTGDKIRLRFAKTGALRLLGHNDLVRSVERMLRRAAVPFRQTQGFHPGPRLVFALSLPLGADALNDVAELELTSPHDADDVLGRMNAHAPEGLTFRAARVVPLKSTAMVRRAVYRLGFPTDRTLQVEAAAAGLLAAEAVWVDRLHPNPRRTNIRPYIRGLSVTPGGVDFDLWVTPCGTARGDELTRLLDLTDAVAGGSVMTRADLELHDELPPDHPNHPGDSPPEGRPETAPLEHVPAALARDAAHDASPPPAATWGLSPNGPEVE